MKILIILTIVVIVGWIIWKYILSDDAKDTTKGCIMMLVFVLWMLLGIVDMFQSCSNDDDRYYEQDPYEDPL